MNQFCAVVWLEFTVCKFAVANITVTKRDKYCWLSKLELLTWPRVRASPTNEQEEMPSSCTSRRLISSRKKKQQTKKQEKGQKSSFTSEIGFTFTRISHTSFPASEILGGLKTFKSSYDSNLSHEDNSSGFICIFVRLKNIEATAVWRHRFLIGRRHPSGRRSFVTSHEHQRTDAISKDNFKERVLRSRPI